MLNISCDADQDMLEATMAGAQHSHVRGMVGTPMNKKQMKVLQLVSAIYAGASQSSDPLFGGCTASSCREEA